MQITKERIDFQFSFDSFCVYFCIFLLFSKEKFMPQRLETILLAFTMQKISYI